MSAKVFKYIVEANNEQLENMELELVKFREIGNKDLWNRKAK